MRVQSNAGFVLLRRGSPGGFDILFAAGLTRRLCVYHTFGSSTWLPVLCFYVRVCTIEQCMLILNLGYVVFSAMCCLARLSFCVCNARLGARRIHKSIAKALLQEWPKH